MNRKYLVFLDIDGVFASARVHEAHNAYAAKMWQRFDPVAIDFMNYIHDTYPVEFVVMSSWKDGMSSVDVHTEHWARAAFANSGFRGLFSTPWKTDPDNMAAIKRWDRGNEVKDYLENFASDVKDFILFDDSAFRFEQILGKKRLIKTDSTNGLLHKHMLNAKSIMGLWEKKYETK